MSTPDALPDAGTGTAGEAPHVSQIVDRAPNAASEPDEMTVLEDLYGPCDEAGFFTGDPAAVRQEQEQEE